MNRKDPPVHADLNDEGYKALLAKTVDSAPAIKVASLNNLATDACLVQSDETDGLPLQPGQSQALCAGFFKAADVAPPDLGEVTEVMLWYDGWALMACREAGSDRILAVALPGGMEVDVAVRRLAGVAVVDGDAPSDEGAGQSLILNDDELHRAGKLPAGASVLAGDDSAADCLHRLFEMNAESPLSDSCASLRNVQVVAGKMRYGMRRIPYAPDHVVAIVAVDELSPAGMGKELSYLGYEILRKLIDAVLSDAKLDVPDTSLPEDDHAFNRVISELRSLPKDDLYSLLRVGGFANHELGEQGEMEEGSLVYRCKECIYYLTNRRWCDLPELPVPVEPDWYCRLWKL